MNSPLVSVIVLTYNHEKYISAAIKSLFTINYTNFEIIVLEDGSEDRTLEILNSLAKESPVSFRVISQNNSGGDIGGNSQRLINEASGKYVLMMSGDDALLTDYPLASMVDAMARDPKIKITFPRGVQVDFSDTFSLLPIHPPELAGYLRTGDPKKVFEQHLCRRVSRVFLQGMLISKQFCDEFGGFDSNLLADDYAFVVRAFKQLIKKKYKTRYEEQALWIYRLHPGNINSSVTRQRQLIFEVVSKYIPFKHWEAFQWDHVEPDDTEGVIELGDQFLEVMGERARDVLVAPLMERHLLRCIEREEWADAEQILSYDLAIAQRLATQAITKLQSENRKLREAAEGLSTNRILERLVAVTEQKAAEGLSTDRILERLVAVTEQKSALELQKLQHQVATLDSQIQSLESELETTKYESQTLRYSLDQRIQSAEQVANDQKKEYEGQARLTEALQAHLDAVLASNSWRLTKPIRGIASFGKLLMSAFR